MLSNSVSNYTYRDIAMNELGHLGVLSVYESEFGSALTNGVTLFHSLAVMLVEYVKTGSQPKVLVPTLKPSAQNPIPTRERGSSWGRPSLTLRVLMLWDRLLFSRRIGLPSRRLSFATTVYFRGQKSETKKTLACQR